jgi:PKD repeat protein
VAAFSGTPRTLTTGQSVQFTDQSTNSPTSWSWNFGDGGTSTAKSPSHTYNTAGTYTVRLTATNSAGSDEETKSGYITVIYAIPTDGLAAYYTFDGNANDQSGNNNNGTVNGSVLMPDRLGNSNSAYYFDGLNDYIEVPNNQSLCLSTFTIIVYVNFDTTSTQKGILTKGYEFGNYTIQLTDEEWPYFVYACEAGNYSHYLKWGTMGNAQFHQLCFSFDKGKIVTYVNGKLELTLSDRPLPIIDNGPLIIGAGYNNIYEGISQFFKGIIDDVLIYNRVLSEDEIQNLYLNY